MNVLNETVTDILYRAAAARNAYALLVALRRAYKNAPQSQWQREYLRLRHRDGAYIIYYTENYYSGQPFLGLNGAPGNTLDDECVSEWMNAVTRILLDETTDNEGETVRANKHEIMSALAFLNFDESNGEYRIPINPNNHMVGIYRRLAEDYTAQAAQLLNSDNTR